MRILLVDDHTIVRKGIAQLLLEQYPQAEIKEACSGQEALQQIMQSAWSIILLDVSMPGRNGIDVLKQIRSLQINTPVLMLSMHPEEQYAIRALKAGASGFLNKERTTEELFEAIYRILLGKKYITASLAERIAENLTDQQHLPTHAALSDRELQVLQLLASGKTVSEVAEEIFLNINTISTYRSRILRKLSLQNNAELMRYALENGLV
ncbi:MAG TPA: response regulator transcription factor [Cyclobacteriaceae bacterium]|nr:response regulator transcription factor [Cyclobacteriaceae bacterium]HRJ82991.1 response regulator transcription factor [Cyclobacteriaceae bacterium]